jgi:hypothetical protein
MSRGGAMPMTSPTAWVYLPAGDCTIRWQRGDKVAYIFAGKQLQACPDGPSRGEALDTITVPSKNWTDLAQVRRTGEKWVNARRQRCHTCGMYS